MQDNISLSKMWQFFFFITNEEWGRCWINSCFWLVFFLLWAYMIYQVITWYIMQSLESCTLLYVGGSCLIHVFISSLSAKMKLALFKRDIKKCGSTWILSKHPDRHKYTVISWPLQTDNIAAVWHTSTKKALEGWILGTVGWTQTQSVTSTSPNITSSWEWD